jgi:hypothetical protein
LIYEKEFFIIGIMKKYLTLKNLGWVLTAIVVFLLGMNGVSKILATDEMIQNFEFMKLTPYMALVGVCELTGLGLLLYPRTSLYGAIIICSIMSGAAAIHLSLMGGAKLVAPVMVGVLAWSGYYLRTYQIGVKK